jgi:hypothetical protein
LTYWGPMPAPNVSGIVNGRTISPRCSSNGAM